MTTERKDGLDESSPYSRKNNKDREVITPTLILPPQGGGDLKVNPSLLEGKRYMVLVPPLQEGEEVK